MEMINYLAGNVGLIIGICLLLAIGIIWLVFAKNSYEEFLIDELSTPARPPEKQPLCEPKPATPETTLLDDIAMLLKPLEERLMVIEKNTLTALCQAEAATAMSFDNHEKLDKIYQIVGHIDLDRELEKLTKVGKLDAKAAQELVDSVRTNSVMREGREEILKKIETQIKKVTKSKSKKVTKKVIKTKKKAKV